MVLGNLGSPKYFGYTHCRVDNQGRAQTIAEYEFFRPVNIGELGKGPGRNPVFITRLSFFFIRGYKVCRLRSLIMYTLGFSGTGLFSGAISTR